VLAASGPLGFGVKAAGSLWGSLDGHKFAAIRNSTEAAAVAPRTPNALQVLRWCAAFDQQEQPASEGFH
jgi:hypothetical protein